MKYGDRNFNTAAVERIDFDDECVCFDAVSRLKAVVTAVKYCSNTGQILVKYWSNTGQTDENTHCDRQILVKYWLNTGQVQVKRMKAVVATVPVVNKTSLIN